MSSKQIVSRNIKCIQINLHHSKAATANLMQIIQQNNIDIALIQEPYNINNQVAGISKQYRVFTSGNGRKRAAIILACKYIDALLLSQLSDEDAVVLEIRLKQIRFYAASIYMDITEDINLDMRKIDNMIIFTKGLGMLLAMDSNARSSMWHDVLTNARGKQLEEFISANNLYLINEDSSSTTYESSRGKSNIDLTVTNSHLVSEVQQWEITQEESCSDHRIITYSIGKHAVLSQRQNFQSMQFIIKEERINYFYEILTKELGKNFLNNTEFTGDIDLDRELSSAVTEHNEMEAVVEKHQNILGIACKKAFKIKNSFQKTSENKSVPWWTGDLTIMRKKTNAARRRYQRTKNNEELRESRKKQYLEEKKKYDACIRRQKVESWKNYCNLTTSRNPWNSAYRLASGKMRKAPMLTTLKKADGSQTTCMEETLHYMLDNFLPIDDETEDHDYHKFLREKVLLPIKTQDDKEFHREEIRIIIGNMDPKKSPGEDGITSDILQLVFQRYPLYMTAIYNGCLRTHTFPKIWKKARIIPIVKLGKEKSCEVSKFRPISLLNTGAKVLEKLLINRIMHHAYSNGLLNNNQYGFTPQRSTVDAAMAVKNILQEGLDNGQYAVVVSLDVKGAFDAAWWPSILNGLQDLNCPGNLYYLVQSYLSERTATLSTNNSVMERKVVKGCPQGSCCGPGLWNIQYNSLLRVKTTANTKLIAFADDLVVITRGKSALEAENFSNVDIQVIAKWAKHNKICFNEEKSKSMLITRRKKPDKTAVNIYLNSKVLEQVDTLKYLGIIFDKKLTFNHHIQYVTDRCTQLINILGRSAKLAWGLKHEALKTIYKGAILPLLSYAAPVWINALDKEVNCKKYNRAQRLINIKIAKSFRTVSNEALCIINGLTPIVIKIKEIAKEFQRREGDNLLLDEPVHFRNWPHPADIVEIGEVDDNKMYNIELYTDGSKYENGVGSGVAAFVNKELVHQSCYKLDSRCSNNQAEQYAIIKALEIAEQLPRTINQHKTIALRTDSHITLDSLRNPNNHNNLIEGIRQKIRDLSRGNWTVDISWVKAHVGNYGNEVADLLAKQGARSAQQPEFNKIPRSSLIRELRTESKEIWQNEWQSTSKGAETKQYFPSVSQRLSTNLPISPNLTSMLTGHGKMKTYFSRFHIQEDATCCCNGEPQTVDHIIQHCSILTEERNELQKAILTKGGTWPTPKQELVRQYLKAFCKFVNKIDFCKLVE